MVQSQQFALQILTEASCKDSMDLGFREMEHQEPMIRIGWTHHLDCGASLLSWMFCVYCQ